MAKRQLWSPEVDREKLVSTRLSSSVFKALVQRAYDEHRSVSATMEVAVMWYLTQPVVPIPRPK